MKHAVLISGSIPKNVSTSSQNKDEYLLIPGKMAKATQVSLASIHVSEGLWNSQ